MSEFRLSQSPRRPQQAPARLDDFNTGDPSAAYCEWLSRPRDQSLPPAPFSQTADQEFCLAFTATIPTREVHVSE